MVDSEVTLDFVQGLAESVGPLILDGFGCGSKSSGEAEGTKAKASAADLVTEFDVRVEETLKSKIKNKFPFHTLFCEESADPCQCLTDEPTWIVDPIDGTTNFVHGFPLTCVSIAFARNKQVLLGVVYSPATTSASIPKELGETEDAEALAKLQRFKECVLRNVEFVITHCRDIRHMGSTAMELCYLAAGRLDCVACFGPKEWDLAAGCLILEEAGAVCSDMQGGQPLDLSKHQVLAAATPELLEAMRKSLRCP